MGASVGKTGVGNALQPPAGTPLGVGVKVDGSLVGVGVSPSVGDGPTDGTKVGEGVSVGDRVGKLDTGGVAVGVPAPGLGVILIKGNWTSLGWPAIFTFLGFVYPEKRAY